MKLKPICVPAFLVLSAISICGQTKTSSNRQSWTLKKGVVVEWLTKGSEGDKAGIRTGDVLLTWSRQKSDGLITSPFDLPYIRFEQAARSPVILTGRRGTKRLSWRLGPEIWGIAVRPNFQEQLLKTYLDGEAHSRAGDLQGATECWRTAARAAPSTGAVWLAPWLLSHAAQALYGAKQWDAADASYQEALQQAVDAGPVVRAEIFRQLASAFKYRDDVVNADSAYAGALAEWQKLQAGSIASSQTLLQMGIVRLDRGDIEQAEDAFRKSLQIAERSAPNSIPVAWSLTRLGTIASYRGDLAKAEECFRRALAIETKWFPLSSDTALTLADLGVLAHQRGNLGMAEIYYLKALSTAERLSPESLEVSTILSDLGECVLSRGNSRRAERYQQRALLIREKLAPGQLEVAVTLANLGEILLARGRTDEAEKYERQAVTIAAALNSPSHEGARILARLAKTLSVRRDFPQAEDYYRRALAMMKRVAPDSLSHLEIMSDLAGTLRHQEELDAAAQLYEQALAGYEAEIVQLGGIEDDRAHYRANRTRYYNEYVDVLIKQGKSALAFEILESSRARTLLEVVSRGRLNIRSGVPAAVIQRELHLRHLLSEKVQYRISLPQGRHHEKVPGPMDVETSDLLRRLKDVKIEIGEISPQYAALTEPRRLPAAEIQQLLGPDTILLEYSLGEERSLVCTVTSDSLQVQELKPGAEIERAAFRLYRALTGGRADHSIQSGGRTNPDADFQKAAAELGHLILDPVADRLAGKRLLIVSDGALQYIPFAVLPSPQRPEIPLVVDHEIVSLPSASVLAEIRRAGAGRPPATREVAVFADPVFSVNDPRVNRSLAPAKSAEVAFRGKAQARSALETRSVRREGFHLARLIYTREESNAILKVTPRGQVMRALDFEATRARAVSPELGRYRIIHFATHGLMDSTRPEFSGLVLSLVNRQGQPQPGFLGLEDIFNLNLPVDLVVLSGCQTALGEKLDGEGLIGITRGFMYAGATRVVASLWNVNDLATSGLMASFYRAMEQEKMPPAAALRKAQIRMWQGKRWHSPYYWGAFQIQGEWR
jgi:CHAT domain-containing protein/tetratricopeptide (TPR) repeat protein